MNKETITTNDLYEEYAKNSIFEDTYTTVEYGRNEDKRCLNILKQLNSAIKSLWAISGLYDGSELLNQHHKIISIDDFADLAIKLEEIREKLFGDTLNYDLIAELGQKQLKKTDEIQKKNQGTNKHKKTKGGTMKDYTRYTSKDGATLTMSQWGGSPAELELYRKLAELEDKIENGTLVELPRMFQDLGKLGWYVEWLDETGVAIHCHFPRKNEAEAKMRELKGEKQWEK